LGEGSHQLHHNDTITTVAFLVSSSRRRRTALRHGPLADTGSEPIPREAERWATVSDDDTVYVAAGSTRYHDYRECQGLSHAREVYERPHSSLPEDFTRCKLCSGAYHLGSSDRAMVTASRLEELDPEDVG